ncbi:MAG: calcium-translocating P-type ATPase, PMCA-type [Oscillospiraceae bacterium]|nr:calcium-translocating P-type ATPase, PMCA-type [Oscillospiraceae bacterium]
MDWYNLSVKEIEKKLNTNQKHGLKRENAKRLLDKFGKNVIIKDKKKSLAKRFFEQLSDFMVIILLFAAGISFISSFWEGKDDYIDTIVIVFIVLLNAVIGVLQESKAEKAIDALKKLSAPKATVIRGLKEKKIPSEEIVPGDVLVLSAGDYIAADARLFKSYNLKVEESSLTGESFYVEKGPGIVALNNAPISSQKNMVFASSTVTSGHALAIAVETGMKTQVGKIAHIINKVSPSQTPLQKNLSQMGKILGISALIICFIIFVFGIFQKAPIMEMFMISISLAVAAIPEGLPAIVTIILSLGVRIMARHKSIIRKLQAVETLGSVSVICSDKTGTLTRNKMTVVALATDKKIQNSDSENALFMLSLASLCNNSAEQKSPWGTITSGDQTEVAIIRALENANVKKTDLQKKFPKILEIPFDSKRKLMTTVHRLGNHKYRVITKGAPDVLLPLCVKLKHSDNASCASFQKVKKMNEAMASEGLRVLAVSYKDTNSIPKGEGDAERNLTFAGLIGMTDPPRPEAEEAVFKCKSAGIKPVMITGDQLTTAKTIAKKLKIFKTGDLAITGKELDTINQKELTENIHNYSVFARVSPEHKVRIVKSFQAREEVVAMTGDGVNDAPALKASDVGCAMGLSGTDVAKSAADMIMTDDNFSTIVEAIRQGRRIYDNIKKTIYFLISSNIGEVVTVLTSSLMHLPTPLLAIQLLWVNLVTDSFPALALGVEPTEKDIMKKNPISKKQGLFASGAAQSMALEGAFIGAISFLAFTTGRVFFDTTNEPIIGRTMAFVVLSLSQVFHVLNVRSEKSIFRSNIFSNKKIIYSFIICIFLQFSVVGFPRISKYFKTANLDIHQWAIVTILSLSPLIIVEIEKFFKNRDSSKIHLTASASVKSSF